MRNPARPSANRCPLGIGSLRDAATVVPVERIELPTFGLQNRCSTAELNRRTKTSGALSALEVLSYGHCLPAVARIDRRGAPSNTRVACRGLQRRSRGAKRGPPWLSIRSGRRARIGMLAVLVAPRDATFDLEIWLGKRHAEQTAVDGCVFPVAVRRPGTDRGARRGSRLLQAICSRRAGSGAPRIIRPGLRAAPSGRALVDRFCGSL